MRYWFTYNVIWNGATGELPNVDLAAKSAYFTDYGLGQFVNGSNNTYLGYIDCDTEENRDIVLAALNRFSATLKTDEEICNHVKTLVPIGSTVKELDQDNVHIDKEVTNIVMANGFPSISTKLK